MWGHAVSRDLIKWAHMPVAIWNDEWFDGLAIYSGSATYVAGKPTIVYAAVGKPASAPYSFSYGLAVPCNRSDPLLTLWCKPDYSPIVNGTSDDPSSAWQVEGGEWRFIGPAVEYASQDFIHWHAVGPHKLPKGDCPSLFPIQGPNPGTYPNPVAMQQLNANWTGPYAGVPGSGVRRCGTVDGGDDITSAMCVGSTADGKLNVTEAVVRARCVVDTRCGGYAQYLPSGLGQPPTGPGSYFRPVTSASVVNADPHWRTYALERAAPPPGPPAAAPTHVHKWSVDSVDFMQVGRWTDETPGAPGRWEPYEGQGHRRIDAGPYAASKDLWDPVHGRRILYGWAQHDSSGLTTGAESHSGGCKSDGAQPSFNGCLSTQSLPRTVTWDDRLRQLVFSPLEEQRALREAALFPPLSSHVLAPGEVKVLGSWEQTSAGNTSEVEVSFLLPAHAARFGISVMGSGGATGTFFFVDFQPPLPTADVYTVGVGAAPLTAAVAGGGTTDTLRLIAGSDKTIAVRVFVDNTVAEAYWQNGRVAMTIPLAPTAESSMAVAAAVGEVLVSKAEAWAVGSIWVTPAEVLLRRQ